MIRRLMVTLLTATMCLLIGGTPLLAISGEYGGRWATPSEYEKDTGNKIEKYNEAPELRTLVAAGELPPVEERLPKEPLVVRGPDGIGEYGGSIFKMFWTPGSGIGWAGFNLISGHPAIEPYPCIAKSFEMIDPTGLEWMIKLREGMKWSDGHPFTADDLVFSFNDVLLNEEFTVAPPKWVKAEEKVAEIEKIDDYTVIYRFPGPFDFPSRKNAGNIYPKHYLRQFHPRYTEKDELEKLAKESGVSSWIELFQTKIAGGVQESFDNPDYPRLKPWIRIQRGFDYPIIRKRNPYFWQVDEEGNQLPYIDEVRFGYNSDQSLLALKVLAGEIDLTEDIGGYELYPEYKKSENIEVFFWSLPCPNRAGIEFNLTCKDPVKREIFRDKRFRFAASHAINREEINELCFLGIAEPRQESPLKTGPFYHERLTHTAIEYDPAKANALLDEMGLNSRDKDGFRLQPDGERLTVNFVCISFDEEFAPIVIDNLKDVGINANLRVVEFNHLRKLIPANEADAAFIWNSWGSVEGSYFVANQATHWVPTRREECAWAPEWVAWYQSDGKEGEKPIPVVVEAIEAYKRAKKAAFDLEEQKRCMKKILDIAADNLWTIGILSNPGKMMLINPKLRNFVRSPRPWWYSDWGCSSLWFYEQE